MIKIYSKSNCPACVNAKNWLKTNNLSYEEVSLDNQEVKQQFMTDYPHVRTVPQLFVIKEESTIHVGGYDKIEEIKKHI